MKLKLLDLVWFTNWFGGAMASLVQGSWTKFLFKSHSLNGISPLIDSSQFTCHSRTLFPWIVWYDSVVSTVFKLEHKVILPWFLSSSLNYWICLFTFILIKIESNCWVIASVSKTKAKPKLKNARNWWNQFLATSVHVLLNENDFRLMQRLLETYLRPYQTSMM